MTWRRKYRPTTPKSPKRDDEERRDNQESSEQPKGNPSADDTNKYLLYKVR